MRLVPRLREFAPWAGARVPREHAASRVSAYVYGNVLVMATLISLHPDDLLGPEGVVSLIGVGISTLIAHMVGEATGRRVREGRRVQWTDVRREVQTPCRSVRRPSSPRPSFCWRGEGWRIPASH